MKIEIDLNEILGDPEYGVETLQESVKRQVVAGLTQKIQTGIKEKIDREVAIAIDQAVKKNIEALTPKLFQEMLEAEYTPVDRYGDRNRGQTTTMRKQLIATIHEQMVYKKQTYDSDKNSFTRTVDAVLSENVALFKKDFDKLVNEMFTKECFAYAQAEMQKKLGIK
jgi:hypothetical protein